MELYKNDLYQHTIFDFAEIALLIIIVFIGTYMNIKGHLYHYHVRQLSTSRGKVNGRWSSQLGNGNFTIFMIHLSITDFFIMYAHGLIEAIWIYTKSWEFGNIFCKIFKYFSTFSYYANAYMVTMIGMDRLISVYTRYNQKSTSLLRKYLMSASAWMVGGILAMPQIFIWQTYEPYKYYTQCVTIFAIAEHENITQIDGYKIKKLKYIYELYHQIFVNWFPFVVLLITYILILGKIMKVSFNTLERLLPQFINKKKIIEQSNKESKSGINEYLSNGTSASGCDFSLDFKNNDKINNKYKMIKKKSDCEKKSIEMKNMDESIPFINYNKKLTLIPKIKIEESLSNNFESENKFSFSSLEIQNVSDTSIRNAINSETSLTDFAILRSPTNNKKYFIPFWRRKWHFKIFTTAILIVCVHFLIWLPYSTISIIRFFDEELYNYLSPNIGRFCETLILINSIINPIIYQLNK
ncbi:Gonadotropin-releasing hormone receptor [Strongyloides ratti]|uniref:Gonadotropin-releasing hormone receptor n=1 Tax=Strongyloides ratti TaxID=34506 RepID=A0A090L2X7_STRRB|nr:Gonadotropin-releasing hormone receptor [Strongyloides ratti]CEF62462.1 Gonadotropin-releasing hormone receptor [Strongyloides ratti]